MIKGYRAEKLNKELKQIAEQYRDTYENARRISEENYKKTLAPGQIFHARQGFYDESSKASFANECERFRVKAHSLLDSVTIELIDETTKAPSTEAVNAISLLTSRKDVSADELDLFMTKYGQDCPLAYASLKEIAENHGYRDFIEHPLKEQAENVQILANSIDRTFDEYRGETGNVIAAVAGFCANVDQAFPAE